MFRNVHILYDFFLDLVDYRCPAVNWNYKAELECRIRTSLAHDRRQFVDIIRRCGGAFPTTVLERVHGMWSEIDESKISGFRLRCLGPSTDTAPSILNNLENNPILAAWYFTPGTCEKVARLWDWRNRNIAFLGTPRLYEWFACAGLGKSRVLLDADPTVITCLTPVVSKVGDRAVEYNTSDDLPPELRSRFDCVFFDPPWYHDEYMLWLDRAVTLAPLGTVLFSLFPELTRPEAHEERIAIARRLRDLLYSCVTLTDYLEYDIPTFEANELNESGIPNLAPWKLSDLVICKVNPSRAPNISKRLRSTDEQWQEVDIGTLRVFVRRDVGQETLEGFLTSPLESGSAVLPSPSRRYSWFSKVNVQSSRGHGLVCSNTSRLIELLERLRFTKMSCGLIDRELASLEIDSSSKRLLSILVREVSG